MNDPNSGAKRRVRLTGIIAIALSIALLAGGTLMFVNNSQHKTDALRGMENINVTLNDGFSPTGNWLAWDGPVCASKSVTNLSDSIQPVWVRLKFKEYLEYGELTMETDGDYEALSNPERIVLLATWAEGEKVGEYVLWDERPADSDYTLYTVDGIDYCRTNNTGQTGGIYGKPIYVKGIVNVFGTADNALHSSQPHTVQDSAHPDCLFETVFWDGTDRLGGEDGITLSSPSGAPMQGQVSIADYISWTLGSGVVSLSDWEAGGKANGDFWVLDGAAGWAYWANGLAPGQTTDEFLKEVELKADGGLFAQYYALEYYIHTDMQAVTENEIPSISDWKVCPPLIP